ncbi:MULTISPECIES: PTS sugar transporter subunit IIA [unclassified Lactobacillus]|uniref:PTS sugar transporter subunit IIA n=1 Tax=unclassified Lactobacillus TaxID=2620435 RepID=UPI000EFA6F16|nr:MULTISPECIES: PTS sugar transporter subunit IIA [unclassified Lactobacillus]RMC47056.1 PTS sugar transporter subunit IIA [Lactobacillus sp. ESL0230]RMC51651.1 PTS sugar transporter subunit IIA [Lactobacillus sp. ESL0225]
MKVDSLFSPKAVFVSDAIDSTAVLREVSEQLLQQDLVKADFFTEIAKREADYPTGIDTSPITKELPNIAVPHTEGEFVNTRLIIPVALKSTVGFKNMIAPDQELPVKFLFMILNNDPEGQANILAQIMDFLRLTSVSKLQELFSLTNPDKIYQFLSEHFEQ